MPKVQRKDKQKEQREAMLLFVAICFVFTFLVFSTLLSCCVHELIQDFNMTSEQVRCT